MDLPYMEQVISSNVSSVGYDDLSGTLFIEFSNGSIYEYYDVPRFEYVNLLNAPSVGSYIWSNIRDVYAYEEHSY